MPHSIIILDREGNPYKYFPEHDSNDGNRVADEPLTVVYFGDTEKVKKKVLKGREPSSDIPPDILEEVEKIFAH